MNIWNSMELMKKYSKCPQCGSIEIGNGNGGVVVENNTFRRFCKCGFDVTLNGEGLKVDTVKLDLTFSIEDLRMLIEFLRVQNWEDTFEIIDKYKLDMNVDAMDDIINGLYQSVSQVL